MGPGAAIVLLLLSLHSVQLCLAIRIIPSNSGLYTGSHDNQQWETATTTEDPYSEPNTEDMYNELDTENQLNSIFGEDPLNSLLDLLTTKDPSGDPTAEPQSELTIENQLNHLFTQDPLSTLFPEDPFGEPLVNTDPYAEPNTEDPYGEPLFSTEPYGEPSTENPFGEPLVNTDPYAEPTTEDPYGEPLISTEPYGEPSTENPFGEPLVNTDPYAEANTEDPYGEPLISTEPYGEPSTENPFGEPLVKTDPYAEPNTEDPFGEPLVNTEPYAEPITEDPYAEPITENPFGEPLINTEPYAETITANPYHEPITEGPYGEPITQDPFSEPNKDDPFSESKTDPYNFPSTKSSPVTPKRETTKHAPIIEPDIKTGFKSEGFELSPLGFLSYITHIKPQVLWLAQQDDDFADDVDRPYDEIDWDAMFEKADQMSKTNNAIKDIDDFMLKLLAALWNVDDLTSHLPGCNELADYVSRVLIEPEYYQFDLDEAVGYLADDARCLAQQTREVIAVKETDGMLESITRTLTRLIWLHRSHGHVGCAFDVAFGMLAKPPIKRDDETGRNGANVIRDVVRRMLSDKDPTSRTRSQRQIKITRSNTNELEKLKKIPSLSTLINYFSHDHE